MMMVQRRGLAKGANSPVMHEMGRRVDLHGYVCY